MSLKTWYRAIVPIAHTAQRGKEPDLGFVMALAQDCGQAYKIIQRHAMGMRRHQILEVRSATEQEIALLPNWVGEKQGQRDVYCSWHTRPD